MFAAGFFTSLLLVLSDSYAHSNHSSPYQGSLCLLQWAKFRWTYTFFFSVSSQDSRFKVKSWFSSASSTSFSKDWMSSQAFGTSQSLGSVPGHPLSSFSNTQKCSEKSQRSSAVQYLLKSVSLHYLHRQCIHFHGSDSPLCCPIEHVGYWHWVSFSQRQCWFPNDLNGLQGFKKKVLANFIGLYMPDTTTQSKKPVYTSFSSFLTWLSFRKLD